MAEKCVNVILSGMPGYRGSACTGGNPSCKKSLHEVCKSIKYIINKERELMAYSMIHLVFCLLQDYIQNSPTQNLTGRLVDVLHVSIKFLSYLLKM